ncbi:MAG: hypothetical protein P1V20_25720 [Verrucomicrobiales bacterium]|nr:hypothetical protein [Verrucomicrobiales bacterium]
MKHVLDRKAQDENYLKKWEKFWSALSEQQKREYIALGINGPELNCFTTSREEFDADRVISTVGSEVSTKPAVLLPELETIWLAEDVPLAIAQTLGNLGSPCYREFSTGELKMSEESGYALRTVLEVIQSEPAPGLGLVIVLKWLDSGLAKYTDRELAAVFGVTFQTVSICRERLAGRFGCPIFAGKSESAKSSYRLSNKKKIASNVK